MKAAIERLLPRKVNEFECRLPLEGEGVCALPFRDHDEHLDGKARPFDRFVSKHCGYPGGSLLGENLSCLNSLLRDLQ